MSWELLSRLSQYGDFLDLQNRINVDKVLSDISKFQWIKYNPNKPQIPRDCINVTSLDGELDGYTGNLGVHTSTDLDFKVPTKVYHSSEILQNFLSPWKQYLGRTQFLRLPPGGYFPPHHDGGRRGVPCTFRLVVPLKNFNPPSFCWMYGDENNYKPLQWNRGHLYFLNTNKKHWLFNAGVENSIWLTMNIKICEETILMVRDLIQ